MGPAESGRHHPWRGCIPAREGWRLSADEIARPARPASYSAGGFPMPSAAMVPPELELRFLDAGVSVERRPDASMVLRTDVPFEPSDALIHGYLRQWALSRPWQKFLAERSADGESWQSISYGEAYDAASRLAASFAARGVGERRPILILS